MSDLEKRDSSRDEREDKAVDSVPGIDDPDAHLSQEEKDKIVSAVPTRWAIQAALSSASLPCSEIEIAPLTVTVTVTLGATTCLENRPRSHSMGMCTQGHYHPLAIL